MSEQRDNSGTLGKNDRQREGKNDPGYAGQCMIDGKGYWISAWVKEGNRGKFFSLAFKPKQAPAQAPNKPAAPETTDQDVPF